MSRFSIDTDAMRAAAGRCDDISNNLSNLEQQIRDVRDILDYDMGRYSGVISALGICADNSRKCHYSVQRYGDYGTYISELYRSSEASVTGNIKYDKFGNKGAFDVISKGFWDLFGDFRDVIPIVPWPHFFPFLSNGPVSALLGLINNQNDNDEKTDTEVKFTKELNKIKKDDLKSDKWEYKDGKWKKTDKDKDDDELEIDVKLKKWESKTSGSLLGDYGHGEVSIEKEWGTLSGNYDLLNVEAHADAYVGALSVGGSVGASFTALSADALAQLGNDDLGIYGKGSVEVGKVGADLSGSIGAFDKNGNFNPNAKIEAGAEAILAKGSASGGVKVLGTDVGAEGSVEVGFDAHAKLGYSDGKLSLDVGAAIGVGASVKLEVDVSGTINAVADGAKAIWNGIIGLFGG